MWFIVLRTSTSECKSWKCSAHRSWAGLPEPGYWQAQIYGFWKTPQLYKVYLSLLGVHRTIYNRAEWWQIRGNETFRFAVRQRTQPCCNVFILKVENYSPVISGATWEKKAECLLWALQGTDIEENLLGKVQSLKQETWILLHPLFAVEVSWNTSISFTCNFKN